MAAASKKLEDVQLIKSVMSKDVAVASHAASPAKILKMMTAKSISCVLIINEKSEPVGIISERDVVKKLAAKGLRPVEVSLNDIMSAPVHVVPADASLLSVSRLMREKRVRRFPVMMNGKLVGIVTETDIFRGLMHLVRHLNWSLVERQINKTKYESLLKEIKAIVN